MVLHGEKTLKTTIQKKLSKSQKFARKVSVAEFRYSQTIFLRFTLILLMTLKLMIIWNFILKLHILSSVEQLRWSFFAEIVNVLQPLVIFSGDLHRRCLTGLRLYLITYYSSKKVWGEAFHYCGYTRESWTPLPPNSLDLYETQKQQDEILDSPH